MIQRPAAYSALEFAVVSSLRAAQLIRGCLPKVESAHKPCLTAQLEVANGLVARIPLEVVEPPIV